MPIVIYNMMSTTAMTRERKDRMMAKKYNDDGMRLTDCCGSVSTYHDETLVCKGCWGAVPHGQGDGMEGRLEYIDDDQKSVAAAVKKCDWCGDADADSKWIYAGRGRTYECCSRKCYDSLLSDDDIR